MAQSILARTKQPGYWAEAAHETAKKEAARAANEFAEAEKEREYQTAWQAGSQYADCLQKLAVMSGDAL